MKKSVLDFEWDSTQAVIERGDNIGLDLPIAILDNTIDKIDYTSPDKLHQQIKQLKDIVKHLETKLPENFILSELPVIDWYNFRH